MQLILIGGITDKFAGVRRQLGEKYFTKEASIDLLNWDTKEITSLFRFTPDSSIRSEDCGRDIRFTSGHLEGESLFVTSPTQAYKFCLRRQEIKQVFNCHHFNDLHNIIPNGEELALSNTGLDSVITMTRDGALKHVLSANSTSVWDKFDRKTDYRLVASTKPHTNHPNFAFYIGQDLWVTRFHNKDAICIGDQRRKIDISVGKPHDGHVVGDSVYFTTINGFVVKANIHSYQVEEVFDLNLADNRSADLGWCRSLAIDGKYIYVGFTKLRETKIESNIKWLRSKVTNGAIRLPSRIAKYDMEERVLIEEFVIPEGYTDLLFSIIIRE